ncbi:MAG: type II secretion system protein GspC [Idiomarina sp.]|nr:type II secretion system protein GspC [Idiomarina sp.]
MKKTFSLQRFALKKPVVGLSTTGQSATGLSGTGISASPQRLLKLALNAIAVVLLLWAAWLAAAITWQMLAPPEPTSLNVSAAPSGAQRAQPLQSQRITQMNLFGERGATAPTRSQPQDAPQTTLNITLVGVTAASTPSRSAAIIQQGANQNTYIIDETIASSRAIVREIYSDRIILENSGRLETLMLDGRDGSDGGLSLTSSAPARAAPVPPANAATSRELPQSIDEVNYTNINDLINITPVQREGELVGYRLSPKASPELFRAAGFQDGDIAVSLNGYDLTNAAEALALMNELELLSSATVVVLRNGDLVELELSIPNE